MYFCGMNNEKDKEEPQANDSQASEPQAEYGKKALQVYNSFEEQEEENYKWLASLSPEQHLHNALELIKRVYGIGQEDSAKKEVKERKIYID